MTDLHETDLSPKSMADAVYTAAVAQIAVVVRNGPKNRTREENDDSNCGTINDSNISSETDSTRTNLMKDNNNNIISDGSRNTGNEVDLGTQIKELWISSDINIETKLSDTVDLLIGEVDSLLQYGLGAFNDLDVTTRQLNQATELAETRSREAQRLQLIDEQSRTSLSVRVGT